MRITLLIVLIGITLAMFQGRKIRSREAPATNNVSRRQVRDKEIAARFAPIFYQGLGEEPRSDFITNFDFDGDWKGDNNWWNMDNRSYRLTAYVYHSVVETSTHYFIHYATFHPRDYKGGLTKSTIVEVLLGEALRRVGKDPTGGKAGEVALSHENDLEGCLVVAEKKGTDLSQAEIRYVETMAHNRYLKYCPREGKAGICEPIEMNGNHPLIFIEPKGHGPSSYTGNKLQLANSINGVMVYSYAGRAEDNDEVYSSTEVRPAGGRYVGYKYIGYDLMPIHDTFWSRAQQGENETFGETLDYETREFFKFQGEKSAVKFEHKLGVLGAAFRGEVGFKNKSRPPWGWFDDTEKDRPRGEWFFDPAAVIARHFGLGEAFSTAYVYNPYLKIGL